jgi:NADPH-dependent ferric siderophore reductase
MLTLPSGVSTEERPAYRPYRATVAGIRSLSPHFTRVTFTGDDFDAFAAAGLDQRIKIIFPLPGVGVSELGADELGTDGAAYLARGGWYTRWRELPDAVRNPFRTYTVRAVRAQLREIDVDFVRHGDGGPAARWLLGAEVGDGLVLIGPDRRSASSGVGLDWRPGQATNLLLAGDETAVPAICSILESLPEGRRAWAFLEVPSAADALHPRLPAGAEITWLARGDAVRGVQLEAAVREWVARSRELLSPVVLGEIPPLADIDVDLELLWDSPEAPDVGSFYAWLAGEAGVIKLLRRFLVSETGVDRSRVAFMGYWRQGRAEAQ